jgi:hypothetical protein
MELVKLNLIFVDDCRGIHDDIRLYVYVRRLDAALVESLGGREGKRLFS